MMASMMTKKALPVYLSDAVRKRLRLAAVQNDTTMTAIASHAIERELDDLDNASGEADEETRFMDVRQLAAEHYGESK